MKDLVRDLLHWDSMEIDPKGCWIATTEKVGDKKTISAVIRQVSDMKQLGVIDLPAQSVDAIAYNAKKANFLSTAKKTTRRIF